MLWEGDDFEWVAENANGRSGGLLILWRKGSFCLNSVFQGHNFLGIGGVWGDRQLSVSIVNMYAPCDIGRKRRLWEEIGSLMISKGEGRWCVLGDFSSIKSNSERKGVIHHHRSEEIVSFCEFIHDCGLIDLPLVGRKYTWYKSDGKGMSRLDRFLISEDWLNSFGNL